MAKKKKDKITEVQLQEKAIKSRNNLIQDTTAGPLILDTSSTTEEEGRNSDGILTLQSFSSSRSNYTYSFRITGDMVEHFKNEARKVSVERKEDVNWQRLIIGAALEKYPMEKEEK